MILLPNSKLDGQQSFERGVDTYQAPVRVPRNQCCLLVNNTTRQDFIGQRPGWEQIPLKFLRFDDATHKYVTDTTLRDNFELGFFQSFSGYVPDFGPSHLVFSISGLIFRVNMLDGGIVQSVPLPSPRPTNRPQVWFCQGEIFLAIQDGQSKPLFYWGGNIRESDVTGQGGTDPNGKALTEMPVGTCMAYSGGRFWVSLPSGRAFVAGDGVYGPTGTAAFQSRDAILRFTENNYLAGGLPFPIPANMGPIRSMVALANLDTSLGQGPLQVFTPSGAFSVDAPFDRSLWATTVNPIKTVSLLDQGALSPVGISLVNGDVWYRSLDGVRSFLIARRDFGTWGNRSMSYEVIKHLKDDDRQLLDHCSMARFDNRLLTTCSPGRNSAHGIFHRGLVVLDFIPLTSMAGSEPPCWDGLWTGEFGDLLQIQTVTSEGIDHCYAAVLAPEDNNGIRRIQLWELTLQNGQDIDATGSASRIQRVMEGPKLDFGSITEQKQIEGCEIWVDKVRGIVDFTLYYRPDEYPCWFRWKHWQVCSKAQRCASDAVAGCVADLNLQEQFRPRMSAMRPPDEVIKSTLQPSRQGCSFQYRLEIVGEAEVTKIKLVANKITEPTFGSPLPEEAMCEEIVCCPPNDLPNNAPGSIVIPPVPPPIGACCIDGVCSLLSAAECVEAGGTYYGDNVPCTDGLCDEPPPALPTGACCTDGVCSIKTRGDCEAGGGVYHGDNTACADVNCLTVFPGVPTWPVVDLNCGIDVPQSIFNVALGIQDPFDGYFGYIGISPTIDDPGAYLESLSPGATEEWARAVWNDFLTNEAAPPTWSAAKLIWYFLPTSNAGFEAFQVYGTNKVPEGYSHVIDLDTKIVVAYCP